MATITVLSYQSGTVSVGVSDNLVNVPISTIDTSHTLLFFTGSGFDATIGASSMMGEFTSPTNVQFSRVGTGVAATLEWIVVEFDSSVNVQHLKQVTPAVGENNVAISAVDLTRSAIITSGYYNSGNTYGSDDEACIFFTSSTNVNVEIGATVTAEFATVPFQVVEFPAAALAQDVQTVYYFGANFTTRDDTVLAVDPLKTLLFSSFEHATGTLSTRLVPIAKLTSPTNLNTAAVSTIAGNQRTNTFIVEFSDYEVVTGEVVNSVATVETAVLSAAPTAPAVIYRSMGARPYVSAGDHTTDDLSVASWAATISANTYSFTRTNALNWSTLSYQIIDWGQTSGPALGLTYSEAVALLNPDHRWSFDGVYTDSISTANGVNTGTIVTDFAICEGVSNCMTTNGVGDRVTLPQTATIDDETDRKTMCGWFEVTDIQQPPCRVWGEGNSTTSISIIIGFGNALTFEVDSDNFTLQIYSDIQLEINRPYHLAVTFESNSFGNEFRAYLDGVKQLDSADVIPNSNLPARTAGEFGDPAGTVSIGGTAILLVAPVNGKYNEWYSFSGAPAVISDSIVRQDLFERGAIPTVVVTNQTELDALANSTLTNAPLCIRVDVADSISLTADNVTFDPLASIHVQYTGTGTLDWTNTNGSDASIGSTPEGGTINFINPATLTINGLIVGAEFRIYDDEVADVNNFDTELDGTESLLSTSFNFAHSGAANTIVIQHMADGYVEVIQRFDLDSSNQTLTLFPVAEINS